MPLGLCCLLGKAVEAALKLAYRPGVGQLPIPLQCQAPCDLREVTFSDVLREGERRASAVTVKVSLQMAEQATKIAMDVVAKLKGRPFHLEVLTVDHTGPSSCTVAHDLLMCPNPSAVSILEQGLHSVEVRCREVVSRTAFAWEKTLTDEALPLWSAEIARDTRLVKSRILVFVSLPRPCTSGPHEIHGSIFQRGADDWMRLWGWAGFPSLLLPPGRASPKPKAAPAPRLALTADQKWKMLLPKLHVEDGWVKMACFLSCMSVNSRHPVRFLDAASNRCWVLGHSTKPKVRKDYLKRSGRRGGGDGSGVFFAKMLFLKKVFCKYYAERWKP